MPKEQYGTCQIREVRISPREVEEILLENITSRSGKPYDFDYDNPIVIKHKGEFIFRFVQDAATHEREPRCMDFKPMPKETS